ncbi:MAG: molybdopterin-dependent oxidoreductase, partial [Chloroflexi bacterium]|nr:molybdopterin-dependent oxidoreductase [Chloroflexota bacterium]
MKLVYDRAEDMWATTKRHPSVVRHKTGLTKAGRLVAMEVDVLFDGGAYVTLSPVVLSRGCIHAAGPYRCPNIRIDGRAVFTNTNPNGAFRGFGAPQTEFAAEMQISRIAERLGLSPAELRRRNVYRTGDVTPTGQVLRESVAGEEVLEQAVAASQYERVRDRTAREASDRLGSGTVPAGRLRSGDRRTANGVGLALAWHGAGFTGSGEVYLASVASVELTADGRIRVLTANTEMGQGTKTVFPQMVANELGVPVDWVEYAPQDTAEVLDSGPTVASRTVMVVGGLVIHAARRLKAEVEARNPGTPFHEAFRDDARTRGATRIDQRFEPYPGVSFDDATYTGDAYP